jgi:hypothetical protein
MIVMDNSDGDKQLTSLMGVAQYSKRAKASVACYSRYLSILAKH